MKIFEFLGRLFCPSIEMVPKPLIETKAMELRAWLLNLPIGSELRIIELSGGEICIQAKGNGFHEIYFIVKDFDEN